MDNYKELQQAIPLIIQNVDCFKLEDFKDKGSHYINWFNLSLEEAKELAFTKADVEIIMPKNSNLYRSMSKALSNAIGSEWVTYDWTVKIIGRILAFSTLDEIKKAIALSKAVRVGMKQIGLAEIRNTAEAFS